MKEKSRNWENREEFLPKVTQTRQSHPSESLGHQSRLIGEGSRLSERSCRWDHLLPPFSLKQAWSHLSESSWRSPSSFAILAQARMWSPKRDPFFNIKYSISPNRDSNGLSEMFVEYIYIYSWNQRMKKLVCTHIWTRWPRSRAQNPHFPILSSLALRILMATKSG